METFFTREAQAACRCKCLGSKLTPFFHIVKVIRKRWGGCTIDSQYLLLNIDIVHR